VCGYETWVNARHLSAWIDAFGTGALRRMLSFFYSRHILNELVRAVSKSPLSNMVVQSLLTFFGHTACAPKATTDKLQRVSGPKLAILRRHVEKISLFNYFPIVDTCLHCEDIAGQSCAMMSKWRYFGDFFRPVFSTSRVQHISDMHSKFELRPHHAWKYGRHPVCDG